MNIEDFNRDKAYDEVGKQLEEAVRIIESQQNEAGYLSPRQLETLKGKVLTAQIKYHFGRRTRITGTLVLMKNVGKNGRTCWGIMQEGKRRAIIVEAHTLWEGTETEYAEAIKRRSGNV